MIEKISERFSEVYSILKCLDKKDQAKIPSNVWKMLESKKSKTYNYFYTYGDEFSLDDYTLAILGTIYKKYLKS